MITDIFFDRYEKNLEVRTALCANNTRFLNQAARILLEDALSTFSNLNIVDEWLATNVPSSEYALNDTYKRVCRELGIPRINNQQTNRDQVLSAIMNGEVNGASEDLVHGQLVVFSLLERLFAAFEDLVSILQARIPERILQYEDQNKQFKKTLGGLADSMMALNQTKIDRLKSLLITLPTRKQNALDELNHRLSQAGLSFRYHLGKFQLSNSGIIESQIEVPFWRLLGAQEWKSAATDFQEALDLRDNGGRDPTAYAMRGLESIVKILCEKSGRVTGNERGFANWVDNLLRDLNGVRIIEKWERDLLVALNAQARNLHSHGPGAKPHPTKTLQQINFCILSSMLWAQNLIARS